MRNRYPFEALHWLRKKRVDHAAIEVSEHLRETVRARQQAASAQAARGRVEQTMAEVACTERTLLEEGQVRVHELGVAAAFQRGAEALLAEEQERERLAQVTLQARLAAEGAARRNLGTASADAELIDAHRGQFQATARGLQERADEEAAEEQWTAKRYPPRRA